MNIEVAKIRQVTSKGSLKAFVDVTIDGLLAIHGCRIIQQPGQQPWVSMPQAEYTKDGRKSYYPVVKILDRQLENEIKETVLAAYKGGK